MRRGQSAIEFLILVGGAAFFFIIFISAVQLNISDRVREQRDVVAREIALTIRDEISLAHNSIDGYYREFSIPPTIAGKEYTVNIFDRLALVKTEDEKHSVAFPILDVIVGDEVLPGKNHIRKDNGIVCINTDSCP